MMDDCILWVTGCWRVEILDNLIDQPLQYNIVFLVSFDVLRLYCKNVATIFMFEKFLSFWKFLLPFIVAFNCHCDVYGHPMKYWQNHTFWFAVLLYNCSYDNCLMKNQLGAQQVVTFDAVYLSEKLHSLHIINTSVSMIDPIYSKTFHFLHLCGTISRWRCHKELWLPHLHCPKMYIIQSVRHKTLLMSLAVSLGFYSRSHQECIWQPTIIKNRIISSRTRGFTYETWVTVSG